MPSIVRSLTKIKKILFPFGRKSSLPLLNSPLTEEIIGVYHIFCAEGWEELVNEQIHSLKDSGLYEQTKTLFVTCITPQIGGGNIEIVKKIVGSKCEIVEICNDPTRFEFPAIDFIYRLAQDRQFYVYYFHTKGVSYQRAKLAQYPEKDFTKLRENVAAWREFMEYFNFYRWNDAVHALSNYDTYGCKHTDETVNGHRHKFYSGNFWWSKSDYIRTLPPIALEQYTNRYFAENWLCQEPEKCYDAFPTSLELYAIKIPPSIYRDDISSSLKDMLFSYVRHIWYNIIKYLNTHT